MICVQCGIDAVKNRNSERTMDRERERSNGKRGQEKKRSKCKPAKRHRLKHAHTQEYNIYDK